MVWVMKKTNLPFLAIFSNLLINSSTFKLSLSLQFCLTLLSSPCLLLVAIVQRCMQVFPLKMIGWIDSTYVITFLTSIQELLDGTVVSLNQPFDLSVFPALLMCRPSGDPLLDAAVCFFHIASIEIEAVIKLCWYIPS